MQEIGKFDVKVSGIPKNGLDKYIAFTINNLVFIDSMQFMSSILDSLIKNLTDNDFKYLSLEFSSEQLRLVKQKEVYPYEYVDSFEKFSKDNLWHGRSNVFSSVNDKCIYQKEYLYAVDVWNMFKVNAMGDYHDLYLNSDVLLFADILEKFICMD